MYQRVGVEANPGDDHCQRGSPARSVDKECCCLELTTDNVRSLAAQVVLIGDAEKEVSLPKEEEILEIYRNDGLPDLLEFKLKHKLTWRWILALKSPDNFRTSNSHTGRPNLLERLYSPH